MDNTLLESIAGKKRELDTNRPLNPSIARKLQEQLALEWTYNSNAIEGNTLSLHETEVVLKQGITIAGKSVNEHLEAINHKDGIEFIRKVSNQKEEMSETVIRECHRIILKGIDDLEAGAYRRTNVRFIGARLIPPQAIKVKTHMDELLTWYYENKYTLPPAILAAKYHYRFVCIHPFIDGNGRVARLLMNLLLMANGYPPAVIRCPTHGRSGEIWLCGRNAAGSGHRQWWGAPDARLGGVDRPRQLRARGDYPHECEQPHDCREIRDPRRGHQLSVRRL